jgi:predicted RNase H-like nuclease
MSRKGIGVDGCRGGWVWSAWDEGAGGAGEWHSGWVRRAEELEALACGGDILIDIPIGLPAPEGRGRACDSAARRALGKRSATVFSPPIRAVLDAPDWAAANHTQRALGAGGISRQAWGLVPKLREVDAWLAGGARVRERVLETHPELLFAALAGGHPLIPGKKSREGRALRLALLEEVAPGAADAAGLRARAHPRSILAPDDILDAMVAGWAASLPAERRLWLGDLEFRDGAGLPQRILTVHPRVP